jgi:hypothetical protein
VCNITLDRQAAILQIPSAIQSNIAASNLDTKSINTRRPRLSTTIKAFTLAIIIFPVMCSAQTSGCDAKRNSVEQEVTYAKADGKSARKIAERQRKVDEAHAELERFQTEAAQ